MEVLSAPSPSSTAALTQFLFHPEGSPLKHKVRALMRDGEPWFVAADVASLLGYSDTAKAIRTHCKGVAETSTPTLGGLQTVKIIPERDVYRLIMRSRLPAAEAFEEWVVGTVLPSLRQKGTGVEIRSLPLAAHSLPAPEGHCLEPRATPLPPARRRRQSLPFSARFPASGTSCGPSW